MFKIPSTVERGGMFLKISAANTKKVQARCRICLEKNVILKCVVKEHTHCLHCYLLVVEALHWNH